MREPIPVTVLVGFLGSGKTTLLNHILANADRRYAVIVNDFAEPGIDAKLVRYRTEELVELSNGCICCTLRGDLLEELRALSELPQMDYILVESTGLGEPLPIAQTFYMDDLRERVRHDPVLLSQVERCCAACRSATRKSASGWQSCPGAGATMGMSTATAASMMQTYWRCYSTSAAHSAAFARTPTATASSTTLTC